MEDCLNKAFAIELRPQWSMALQASNPCREDWRDALCRVCCSGDLPAPAKHFAGTSWSPSADIAQRYRRRFVGGSSSSRVGAGWVAWELELPPTRTNLLSISPVFHYSNTPQFCVSS